MKLTATNKDGLTLEEWLTLLPEDLREAAAAVVIKRKGNFHVRKTPPTTDDAAAYGVWHGMKIGKHARVWGYLPDFPTTAFQRECMFMKPAHRTIVLDHFDRAFDAVQIKLTPP